MSKAEKKLGRYHTLYHWYDVERNTSHGYFTSWPDCLVWAHTWTRKPLILAQPGLWWPMGFLPHKCYFYADGFAVVLDDTDGSVAGYILRCEKLEGPPYECD
jgi:hypothetical protein